MIVIVGNSNDEKTSIIYSKNGGLWWSAVITNNIFISSYGIAWNGKTWVAVGNGNYSIAYSNDGINWTGVANSNSLLTYGYGIAWNGKTWVAVGKGNYSIAYSNDGINWTGVANSNSFFSQVNPICSSVASKRLII
jgi:hypothetical protein